MIARDGFLRSLWQDSTDSYTPVNITTDTVFEVAIIGGGITGIVTAWELQRAGKKCVLLEAETLCYGTTGGTTAHLNTLLDTPYTTIRKNFGKEHAKQVADAVKQAIARVGNNIQTLQVSCGFGMADAFLFSQTAEQTKELEDIAQASLDAGLAIAFTSDNRVPIPFDKVLRVPGQAKFHPVAYCHAIAASFEAMGGRIVQHCRVTGLQENDRVQLTTAGGVSFEADAVVMATHVPTGINLLHLRCIPYRSYALAATLEDASQYPDALVYDSQDPYHYYRTQVVDGQPYLIAGGEDHKTGHDEHTVQHLRSLEAHLRKYFSVKNIAYQWSSQYYESTDGLPYIGKLPGSSNIYVATGFGGNGMVYSHVAAFCLAQLLTGHDHPYPFLDPNRIKPVAGFTNFISHNMDVAGQLIKKLLPSEQLDTLSDMAKAEARVVKHDKEIIAVYKDENGNIHAIDPACTHMKCHVAWNDAERSWDCPCHGARFSFDGQVLNAPASKPLQQVVIAQTTGSETT